MLFELFLTSLEEAKALKVIMGFQELGVVCGFVENTYCVDFDHFEGFLIFFFN